MVYSIGRHMRQRFSWWKSRVGRPRLAPQLEGGRQLYVLYLLKRRSPASENMWRYLRLAMVSILAALPMTASAADPPPKAAPNAAAAERTRTFAVQKCRYTLPGNDWTWREQ